MEARPTMEVCPYAVACGGSAAAYARAGGRAGAGNSPPSGGCGAAMDTPAAAVAARHDACDTRFHEHSDNLQRCDRRLSRHFAGRGGASSGAAAAELVGRPRLRPAGAELWCS